MVVAKDAVQQLRPTLDSILNQSLPPQRVVVVDDGSRDATPAILSEYARKKASLVEVVTLVDRGYDIRRVPANINKAWMATRVLGLKTDYFMISGDDCIYPRKYASTLISRMRREPETVVASGHPTAGGRLSKEHSPSGSGRMVNSSFWTEIGEEYPVKAGWETWLLYKAQEKGYRVKLFNEVVFEHVRPRGAQHQLTYWGAAMHNLGYHQLYAFGRIARNVANRSITFDGSLSMLRGYTQACLGSADPFISPYESSLRKFVYASQIQGITKAVGSLLRLKPISF